MYTKYLFLDASAIIAWLLYPDVEQPGGLRLHGELHQAGSHAYSNQLCLTEALSRFKWMRHYGELSDDGYGMRVYLAAVRVAHNSLRLSDFDCWDLKHTKKAQVLVEKYKFKIDFLDALQIVDVVDGPFKEFAGPSKTVLVTCDGYLRDAARAEGVRVWHPVDEENPDAG